MLNEIGIIASVVGALVSLPGLGFALIQLHKLRGETQAAREAAEATRRLLRRNLTGTNLTRLSERIQSLIEIHRSGDRARALDRYPDVRDLLINIRRQHPDLSPERRSQILGAAERITSMQMQAEALSGDLLPQEIWTGFNYYLVQLQTTLLAELEDQLQ